MTNAHINKQGMYLVVIGVLGKFAAVVATLPALAKVVAAFTQIVTNIGKTSEDIGIGTSPKTDAKRAAESAMAESVVTLVGKLHAYAAEINDVELMEDSNVTETMIHDTREANRAGYATKLVDTVEAHKADLAGDYAVADADIAAARQLIANYSATLGDRDSTRTEQTSGRESVMKMFEDADTMLEHRMDRMMKSFQTANPDFYAQYEAARVIKDIAAHRKAKNNGGNTDSSNPKPPESK